jgi:hypothetical protein
MKKLKILLVGIIAFIFSGFISAQDVHDSYRPYAPYETYIAYEYPTTVFINYDFYCSNCFYEIYYCFYCTIFHVRINLWCHNHYNWYYNWYRINYYQPYGYYHKHYTGHRYYRDVTRHYVRDQYGVKKLGGKRWGRHTPKYKKDTRNRTERYRDKLFDKKNPPKIREKIFKQRPPVKNNKPRQNTKSQQNQTRTKNKKNK